MAILTAILALASPGHGEPVPLFEIVPVLAEYQNAPVAPPAPPPPTVVTREVIQSVPAPPSPPPPSVPMPAKMLQPLNPGSWVTNDDYPPAALRGGMAGQVRFTLSVDTNGVPTDCTITGSSGFPLLDETSCTLLKARARFNPAEDAKGRRIPATYSNRFRWEIPKDEPLATQSWASEFRFTIGPEGAIVSCSERGFGAVPAYPQVACERVSRTPRPLIVALRGEATGPVTIVLRFSHTVSGTPLPVVPALSAAFKPVFTYRTGFGLTPEGLAEKCVRDIGNGEIPTPESQCAAQRPYMPGPAGRTVTMIHTVMTDGDPYIGPAVEAMERWGE